MPPTPGLIYTPRLMLRKPEPADAEAIFDRYSGDPLVTRYLSWRTHRSLTQTRAFLAWSDTEWARWPAGPFLVFSKAGSHLLGSTGLTFRSPACAMTGYALARDAWGHGYATESLQAMVALARQLGVQRLEAICHVDHRASAHVLEKCGFGLEGIRCDYMEFPNLAPGRKSDILSYVHL